MTSPELLLFTFFCSQPWLWSFQHAQFLESKLAELLWPCHVYFVHRLGYERASYHLHEIRKLKYGTASLEARQAGPLSTNETDFKEFYCGAIISPRSTGVCVHLKNFVWLWTLLVAVFKLLPSFLSWFYCYSFFISLEAIILSLCAHEYSVSTNHTPDADAPVTCDAITSLTNLTILWSHRSCVSLNSLPCPLG